MTAYKQSSRFWLLILSLYCGVNNDVINDCLGYVRNLGNCEEKADRRSDSHFASDFEEKKHT